MVAENKHSLATNNIFTNVVVSLLTSKYWFSPICLRHIRKQDPLLTDIRLLQGTRLL